MFKKCDVCQKSVGKKDNYCKNCGAMLQLKGKNQKRTLKAMMLKKMLISLIIDQ